LGLRQAAVILVGPALDPTAGGESFLYDADRARTKTSETSDR
jgi:precorrin-4/cobalt-precorrin-4 C11-methyltransferase